MFGETQFPEVGGVLDRKQTAEFQTLGVEQIGFQF